MNIQEARWVSPLLRVGAQVAFVSRFHGRRLEYAYEVVGDAPDERLVRWTAEGPFPMG